MICYEAQILYTTWVPYGPDTNYLNPTYGKSCPYTVWPILTSSATFWVELGIN